MRTTIALALLLMAETANAQPLPRGLGLQEVGASRPNTVTFHCDGDWESKEKKAHCTFVTTYVTKPDPKDTKKKLEALKASAVKAFGPSAENAEKAWQELCPVGPDADPKKVDEYLAKLRPFERKLIQEFLDACDARSLPKLLDWYISSSRVEAETCTVHTLYPKTGDFTQKDENKWEGIDGDNGPFQRGGTVVMTLWKRPKDFLWNYREVRAGEVNCESDALHDCREPGMVEWQWHTEKPGLECKYVTTD